MNKRFRDNYYDDDEEDKLIPIFSPYYHSSPHHLNLASGIGKFQCKTCGRWFPTFQALGGHRTAHNRPSRAVDLCKAVPAKKKKKTVHVCSICGLQFSVGQALGGHMRRHRGKENVRRTHGSVTDDIVTLESITAGSSNDGDGDGDGDGRSSDGLCLELRLSPPDCDVGFLNLSLGLGV